MFLLIPLGLAVLASAGIAFIVSKKLVYLKKLAPEVMEHAGSAPSSFLHSFVTEYSKNINIREHGINFLAEVEKGLRRLRLFFVKIEASTSSVIEKIRIAVKQQEELLNQQSEVLPESQYQVQPRVAGAKVDSKADEIHHEEGPVAIALDDNRQQLRAEEQQLIMAIAKSPRSAELYKQLGDIYIQTNELDDARQSFEAALELDPFDYIVKTKLSRIRHEVAKA